MGRVDPKRLSLHAGTLRPVQRFEEKAALTAGAGFGAWALRGVEVEGYLAEGRTIGEVRQLNEKHGLTISETGSLMQWQFTGGVPLLNSFQRPAEATDGDLQARADRMLGWTRALGCDLVAAIGAYEADGTVDEAVRDFRCVCTMAARHGVRVAFEVLGFATHFHTLAQAWEVVRRAECDNGGLLLDTYHFYRGGSTLEMLDAIPVERLYLVHLADVPPGPREETQDDGRLPPGEGVGPLRDIVTRVLDKGYAGYFVVEVLSQPCGTGPPRRPRLNHRLRRELTDDPGQDRQPVADRRHDALEHLGAFLRIEELQWATPVSAQSLPPVPFQLNFTAGGYNAGFALALQEGMYKKAGLDVTIIKGQGSGVTAQLVASGKADIAYADALAVMQLIAKGAPMKIVSTIYQSNPNAVTMLTTSGIKSIAELRGRSVAVPSGQSQTAMIPILFKANGLAESDVNLVNMPGNAMIASLLQKQVDAMLGSLDNYDLIFRQRGVDIFSLPFADHGVATVSTSIIASDAALAQRGDVVRKFIQASLEGWDAAVKRPDDAIKALVQTFPTDTEPPRNLGELKAAISLMCKNGAKFVGKAEAEAWSRTVSVAQQVLGLSTSVPASAYYTHEFLPATLPTKCPLG